MRPILHKIVTDVDTEKRKRFRKGPIAVLNVGIRRQEITTLRRIFWPSDWMAWEQSQEAIAFRRWSSHIDAMPLRKLIYFYAICICLCGYFWHKSSKPSIGIIIDDTHSGERELAHKIKRAAENLGWKTFLNEKKRLD